MASKWTLGMLHDSDGMSGLSVRRPFSRQTSAEVWWKTDADGQVIAAMLRRLAALLEEDDLP